jgi:hypothetical protein
MSRRVLWGSGCLAVALAACPGEVHPGTPELRDAAIDGGGDSGSTRGSAERDRSTRTSGAEGVEDLGAGEPRRSTLSAISETAPAAAPALAPIGAPFTEPVERATESTTGVVAAAARPGFMAAWNRKNAFITTDDGRTWSRVLDGRGAIVSVAMDDDGTLHVVRSNRTLATRAPDGTVARAPIADARSTIAFAARGGRLAWWGRVRGRESWQSTLRYSDDGGTTWIEPEGVDVHDGNFARSLEVLDDGTIVAWAADEMECGGGARFRWRVSPEGRFETTDASVDPFLLAGRGADGVVYSLDRFCAGAAPNGGGEGPLCSTTLDGDTTQRAIFDTGEDWQLDVVTNGELTLGLLGRRLLSLDPLSARVIDPAVPPSIELAGVDADGRALGLANRRLVRRELDGKWRILR